MKHVLRWLCLVLGAMINARAFFVTPATVSLDASHWQELALGVDPRIEVQVHGRSVYFLGDLFAQREPEVACTPFDLLTITDPGEFNRCKRLLVDEYKIHIMPDPFFMDQALIALLSAVRDDRDFARLLYNMKIIMATPAVEAGKLLPMIVLYPLPGHEIAQQLAQRLPAILTGIPPLSIAHLSLNAQRLLSYPAGAPLCPRDNVLFTQESGPLICYAQGGGIFKEEMIMAANFVSDSFTAQVYRQPVVMSGIYLYRPDDLAAMFGYNFGVYLTHDQLVMLSEMYGPWLVSGMHLLSGAFVFHSYKDLTTMKLRALGSELLARRVLSADEITELRQKIEKELAAGGNDLSRSIYQAGLKSIDDLQDQEFPQVRMISADTMAERLAALVQRPVLGPISFGDLYYDHRENKALYPPDFLDDGPHDFHLTLA